MRIDTRKSHDRLTPMIAPRLSRSGKLTTQPLHHKSPVYQYIPKAPIERKNMNKFYPKSGKALGTVSRCPICGLKGQLALMFRYDSCIDNYQRKIQSIYIRNLKDCHFSVRHVVRTEVNGKVRWVHSGNCRLSLSFLEELNGLLLRGRVIPEFIERVMLEDKFGLGYDLHGVKIWSGKK